MCVSVRLERGLRTCFSLPRCSVHAGIALCDPKKVKLVVKTKESM